jgi:hypothetical protein
VIYTNESTSVRTAGADIREHASREQRLASAKPLKVRALARAIHEISEFLTNRKITKDGSYVMNYRFRH